MNAQRELSDSELVTLAAVHINRDFADAFASLIDLDATMDDAGEITVTSWPYHTKASFLLATWQPAGKPS